MMDRDILKMDNVRIIQPNFAGRGGMYNREGDRNFLVVFDSVDIANELARDGWNVKIKEPKEEGDEPFCFLSVKVHFNKERPNLNPAIYLRSGNNMRELDEETVGMLDDIMIESADLDIRPFDWEVNGKTGRSAYLLSICVTQKLNRHMLRYEEEKRLGFDEIEE